MNSTMRQAIETKYFGPTNTRGSRIRAKCAAKTIYMPYKSELDVGDNHRAAARVLMKLLGWDAYLAGGVLASGDHCFVLVKKRREE